jgi:RecG-like helicase
MLQLSLLTALGLAVIDEEQRFGVQQRNTLTEGHTVQQQQQQQHDNNIHQHSDETTASTVDFCEHQYKQSLDKRDCHVLYMSATPIPRSLGLTVFGNIDVVRLNQKPPNSEQVQTTVVSTDKLMDVSSTIYSYCYTICYVVCACAATVKQNNMYICLSS